jgi:hypothetical protein
VGSRSTTISGKGVGEGRGGGIGSSFAIRFFFAGGRSGGDATCKSGCLMTTTDPSSDWAGVEALSKARRGRRLGFWLVVGTEGEVFEVGKEGDFFEARFGRGAMPRSLTSAGGSCASMGTHFFFFCLHRVHASPAFVPTLTHRVLLSKHLRQVLGGAVVPPTCVVLL